MHWFNTLPISRNFPPMCQLFTSTTVILRTRVHSSFCAITCTLHRCGIFIPNGKIFRSSSGVGTFLALFPPFNLWTETKKIKRSVRHVWELSTRPRALRRVIPSIQASIKFFLADSRFEVTLTRLSVGEDFTDLCRREDFKTYIYAGCFVFGVFHYFRWLL
jgi:hypothetical protein